MHPAVENAVVYATPIGPDYPPPGGVNWSGSGDAGQPGGETWNYSAFNFSEFSSLYWGLTSPDAIQLSLDGVVDSAGENPSINYLDASGQSAFWAGSSTFDYFDGNSWQYDVQTRTRLKLTVSGNAAWISAGSIGLPNTLGYVLNITGDYSLNILFEGFLPGADTSAYSWVPADYGINNIQTNPNESVIKSMSGGFYYTPKSPVLEPSTILLLGAGLLGIAGIGRKKLLKK